MQPGIIHRLLLVSALAAVFLATGCASHGPQSGPVPPGTCPDGWRAATPPLNPMLVCLPDTVALPTGDVPPGGCPEGWRQATPPLNPVLGCLPTNFAP